MATGIRNKILPHNKFREKKRTATQVRSERVEVVMRVSSAVGVGGNE